MATQRRWRRAVAGALLVAVAALAGSLLVVSSSGPRLLSRVVAGFLGRPVQIGSVELHLGRELGIELRDLAIFDVGGEQELLSVRSAFGLQRWPELLTGQFLPLAWTLQSPRLRLRPGAAPAGAGLSRLPPLALEIHDGVVEWERPGHEPIWLVGLELRASRASLPPQLRGEGQARLWAAGADAGGVSGRFEGWIKRATLALEFDAVHLGALGLHELPGLAGLAGGSANLHWTNGTIEGDVDLRAKSFRIAPAGLHAPIAPAQFELAVDLAWTPTLLWLRPHPLRVDDLVAWGELEIGTEPAGRVRGWVTLDDFQPGQPNRRLQFMRLVGLRHPAWRDFDRRVEAGWLRNVRFDFDLERASLGQALNYERVLAPEELRIAADMEGGVYRPRPGEPALEGISGQIRIDGNTLFLRELHMSRAGRPVPELWIRVDGMHRLAHLPPEERRTPEGPGRSIPGLGALFRSLRREATPERPETVMRVWDCRIGYPGFVFPLREASGALHFSGGNLLVDDARAIYGGVPARIRAYWDRSIDRLDVDVAYEDGDAPPGTPSGRPPQQSWLDGRLALETLYLGDWRLEAIDGSFHGDGPTIELTGVSAHLAGGELAARGFVSLADENAAPFGFVVDLAGADAASVATYLGMSDEALTGSFEADGTLSGRLSPERPFFADADVRVDARLRGGTVGRTPRTLLLARLVSPMGWTGLFGRPLPYEKITTEIVIKKGHLRVGDFALEGPQLGVAAAGEIDLLSAQRDTNLVVALLLFENVGGVLQRVPVVGELITGKDRSLVTLYFQLEGPWSDPGGYPLPPAALQTATGWAGRMLTGGVRRLVYLVLPRLEQPGDGEVDGSSAGQSH